MNRLSDPFPATFGLGVEITLTAPLNDSGNIGVFCSASGENHYENATVSTHRWSLTTTTGTCFVYSWRNSTYRPGLTGAGYYNTKVPVEPGPASPNGTLSFAGVPDNRPSVANRLTGLFTPAVGSTVTITLTQALGDSGNIGVYCVASGENHYGSAFVGSRSYAIASPGDCFIYSWLNSTFRPWLSGAGTYSYTEPQPSPSPGPSPSPTPTPPPGTVPTIGVSWQGESQSDLTPPDPTGAIGPSSYIQLTNLRYQIAGRNGSLISNGDLGVLTGLPVYELSDPQVLWDPGSQRFFYLVLDVYRYSYAFGYSLVPNPTSANDFCRYLLNFGYGSTLTLPDYPKMAVTNDFVLIGSNDFYFLSQYVGSNLDYVYKPPADSCPSSLAGGQFQQLRNADGSLSSTPVPVVNADPTSTGWVVATQDVGTGPGTYISVFRVTKNEAGQPVLDPAVSIPVESYTVPASALQSGTTASLDTLDTRFRQAVAGFDPLLGATAIWTSHAVFGGAGSEERWYEISTAGTPSLAQAGKVTSPMHYVWNAGISSNRANDGTTGAYGSHMVMGFSTSSSTEYSAIQMVSKNGADGQSPWVMIKQSPGYNQDNSCNQTCRWGDYGGAAADPVISAGGQVWLSGEWNVASGSATDKDWRTWNWSATP